VSQKGYKHCIAIKAIQIAIKCVFLSVTPLRLWSEKYLTNGKIKRVWMILTSKFQFPYIAGLDPHPTNNSTQNLPFKIKIGSYRKLFD